MEREQRNGHATLNGYENNHGAMAERECEAIGAAESNGRGSGDKSAVSNGHVAVGDNAVNGAAAGDSRKVRAMESRRLSRQPMTMRGVGPQPAAAVAAVGRGTPAARTVGPLHGPTAGHEDRRNTAQEEEHSDMSSPSCIAGRRCSKCRSKSCSPSRRTLSPRVLTRARMLRVMKTARAMRPRRGANRNIGWRGCYEPADRDHAGAEGSGRLADGRPSPQGRGDGTDRGAAGPRRLHARSK